MINLVEFILLLTWASLFNQTHAASYHEIEKPISENFSEYYSQMRENNVYRGVLLSKNKNERNELCSDMLSLESFRYKQIVFADEDLITLRTDKPYDPVVIKTMTNSFEEVIAETELFLICHGFKEGTKILQNIDPYYISSAFKISVFHLSEKDDENSNKVQVIDEYEMAISPKTVPLNLNDLEELYIHTYQNIDVLRKESPRYVELVEARDDIQALSDDERLGLCASLLSTPNPRSQNFAVDLEFGWVPDSNEKFIENLPLYIQNENFPNYKVSSDNVLCRASNTVHKNKKDFYYTRSYNNKNSVYFMDKHDSDNNGDVALQFNLYFEDIPLLMNAKRTSRAGPPTRVF